MNSNLQWFDPPLDLSSYPVQLEASSLRLTDAGYVGIAPDLWGMHLSTTIERLWTSDVGQAVIECVRRRTTIYPTIGGAQTLPDRYDDNPLGAEQVRSNEQGNEEASSGSGTTAMVFIDLNARVEQTNGAAIRSPDVSLLHELVHAVNITRGGYRNWTQYSPDERARRGAPSPEEELAVIIDNMYRSERGMWLRTQYDSPSSEYSAPGTTRLPGRQFIMQAVADYHRRVPPLAASLARIERRRCRYNPFRDYRQLPVNARP